MERVLIDRKEILEFLEEDFGFWEYIRVISPRVGIDENEAIELADEVRLTIKDAIESMPVIEEREETSCICSVQKEDAYDCFYGVYYYTCGSCFEFIKTETEEDNFKFCPYCGAQYTGKVIYEENK